MILNITGRNIEVTPAIRDYVQNKIGRLDKFFDTAVEAQIILSVERLDHNAEVTLHVKGKTLHCSESAESLYAAIDLLTDKFERQIIKYKTKNQGHPPHVAHKRLEDTEDTLS